MDGEDSWILDSPTLDEILQDMANCLKEWPIDEELDFGKPGFDKEAQRIEDERPAVLKLLAIWSMASFIQHDAGKNNWICSCINYIFLAKLFYSRFPLFGCDGRRWT